MTRKIRKAVWSVLLFAVLFVQGRPAMAQEKEQIVVAFRTNGIVPDEENVARIEHALNEQIRDRLDCEVKLVICESSSYKQQMTLMLAGGEQVDVLGTTESMMSSLMAGKQIWQLDDLMEQYGSEIREILGEELLSCGKYGGKQYFIPVLCDSTIGNGTYMLRKDLVEKYQIQTDQVKTYEDLTKVFETVQAGEPEMVMTVPWNANMSFLEFNCNFDRLTDYFGVLEHYGQDELRVTNLFESQEYRDYLKVMRTWYVKGFIDPDITSITESGTAQIREGKAFSVSCVDKPGKDTQFYQASGYEGVPVQVLHSAKVSSTVWQWAIPKNSKDPEKAMQFISLLYTDPDVLNLLVYGEEGVDYEKREDGRIGYPKEGGASAVGYSMSSMLWAFGNEFNAYVWETDDADIWEKTKEWNQSGYVSKAYGFVYDSTPVATEVAAVQNIYDQYKMALECGLVDPDAVLPELNEKLYAAGLQEIIDEKQRQLSVWSEERESKK